MAQSERRAKLIPYNPQLSPPIAWLGGKSKLRSYIIEMMVPHRTYVEVFGGAGWVLFGKGESRVEVYNDVNSELVTLWKVIQNPLWLEEFFKRVEFMLVSREQYREFSDADPAGMDMVDRAIRFFYLLRLGFGGQIERDLQISQKSKPPEVDKMGIYKQFIEAQMRLRNVYIEHLSFDELIPRYDTKDGDSYFFCDPPYYETKGYSAGRDGKKLLFGPQEHRVLRSILEKVRGKWLLTCNDHPEIRKLYDGYEMREVDVMYTMCKDKKGAAPELIITNYSASHTQLNMFGMIPTKKKIHIAGEILKSFSAVTKSDEETRQELAKLHARLDARVPDKECFGKFGQPAKVYMTGQTSDEKICERCVEYHKCKRESLVYD